MPAVTHEVEKKIKIKEDIYYFIIQSIKWVNSPQYFRKEYFATLDIFDSYFSCRKEGNKHCETVSPIGPSRYDRDSVFVTFCSNQSWSIQCSSREQVCEGFSQNTHNILFAGLTMNSRSLGGWNIRNDTLNWELLTTSFQ